MTFKKFNRKVKATARTPPPTECRLAFYGDEFVGKSALAVCCKMGVFLPDVASEWDHTVTDTYRLQHTVTLEDNTDYTTVVDILDPVSNSELGFGFSSRIYRSVECFVFLFSMCSRSTFESMPKKLAEISRIFLDIPFGRVLVATRADEAAKREVSREEAQLLARQYCMEYVEVSAKEQTNITQLLDCCFFSTWKTYDERVLDIKEKKRARRHGQNRKNNGGLCMIQ
jgi:GTPase SAR1 family protein